MAYRKPTTARDAMFAGISGLGDSLLNVQKNQTAKKLADSQLLESGQAQEINTQKIAAGKKSAAQAMQSDLLIGSLEAGGALSPTAMTGTGPGNNVNMDEVKAARKFDNEAKLWNQLNQDKEGFTPLTGKKLRELAEAKGLENNKLDQKGVIADEFQSNIAKDPALSATEKSFYGNEPKAFGERLKPVGVTYLPTDQGFVPAPNRIPAGGAPGTPPPAAPLRTESGAVPRPVSHTPPETKWVSKTDAEGNTYQENPVTGETRDTGRKAHVPGTKGGKAAATPADLVSKAQQGIDVIDQMIGNEDDPKSRKPAHPGFESAVGMKGLSSLGGLKKEPIAGTSAADFMALYNQISGQAFLESREQLKGSGAITDMEGQKAQAAVTRMNTAQSEKAFKAAGKEFRAILVTARERAKKLKAQPAAAASGVDLSDDDIIGSFQ